MCTCVQKSIGSKHVYKSIGNNMCTSKHEYVCTKAYWEKTCVQVNMSTCVQKPIGSKHMYKSIGSKHVYKPVGIKHVYKPVGIKHVYK